MSNMTCPPRKTLQAVYLGAGPRRNPLKLYIRLTATFRNTLLRAPTPRASDRRISAPEWIFRSEETLKVRLVRGGKPRAREQHEEAGHPQRGYRSADHEQPKARLRQRPQDQHARSARSPSRTPPAAMVMGSPRARRAIGRARSAPPGATRAINARRDDSKRHLGRCAARRGATPALSVLRSPPRRRHRRERSPRQRRPNRDVEPGHQPFRGHELSRQREPAPGARDQVLGENRRGARDD